MKRQNGFTFIELLIVVAMIAILAAISVPNFLEAQIRSKLSRVSQDMDVIEAALHAYFADYNAYPPSTPQVLEVMDLPWSERGVVVRPISSRTSMPSTSPTPQPPRGGYGYGYSYGGLRGGSKELGDSFESVAWSGLALNVLTTPVAYITGAIGKDPFSDFKSAPIGYANLIEAREKFNLSQDKDSRRYILYSWGPCSGLPNNPFVEEKTLYDPTNGTTSAGVVARFGN